MYALLAVLQHGAGDICIDLAIDNIKQRMQGTVSIPNGKDRIVCKTVSLMNIMIQSTILPRRRPFLRNSHRDESFSSPPAQHRYTLR